jgi:O-antigen/teichoic acid export membrane protein
MKIKLPRLFRGEFFRNVFTLISGTTLAQIISLAIYPVLSRMYTPDDFGVFALYMSILSITNITATAKYELAVMMPSSDRDGMNLVGISGLITVAVSLVLLILVVLLNRQMASALGNDSIAFWLYLIPFSTFLNGLYQSLNYWSIRNKRFRNITGANLSQSLANSSVKLGAGVMVAGPSGLIAGAITGQLTGFLTFLVNFLRKDRKKIEWINRPDMRSMAKEYYRFPKYNMLLGISNNFSSSLPIFILTAWFSTAIAGLYSFGLTMIFRPMNLVTTAFSQVFSQRIISKVNDRQPILDDVRRLFTRMFQFSVLPFAFVGVFAPLIFRLVFGPEWETAGRYTRILIPWLFLVFMSAPFAFLPDLFKKQGKALVLDIIKLTLRAVALFAGVYFGNIFVTLILLSAVSSVVVIYQIVWYFTLAGKQSAEAGETSEKKNEAKEYGPWSGPSQDPVSFQEGDQSL